MKMQLVSVSIIGDSMGSLLSLAGEVRWRSVKMLLLHLRAVPGISEVPGSQGSTETFQLGPQGWLQVCQTKKEWKGKSRQKKKNLQRHRGIQWTRAGWKLEVDLQFQWSAREDRLRMWFIRVQLLLMVRSGVTDTDGQTSQQGSSHSL